MLMCESEAESVVSVCMCVPLAFLCSCTYLQEELQPGSGQPHTPTPRHMHTAHAYLQEELQPGGVGGGGGQPGAQVLVPAGDDLT